MSFLRLSTSLLEPQLMMWVGGFMTAVSLIPFHFWLSSFSNITWNLNTIKTYFNFHEKYELSSNINISILMVESKCDRTILHLESLLIWPYDWGALWGDESHYIHKIVTTYGFFDIKLPFSWLKIKSNVRSLLSPSTHVKMMSWVCLILCMT